MEKLIELLNEYEEENKKKIGEITYVRTNAEGILFAQRHGINALSLLEARAVLVNKKYGFIKWLVENDKIDFDKVMKLGIPCFVRYDKGEIISVHDVDSYKQLIMILSIQDNPIYFLISILKIS